MVAFPPGYTNVLRGPVYGQNHGCGTDALAGGDDAASKGSNTMTQTATTRDLWQHIITEVNTLRS